MKPSLVDTDTLSFFFKRHPSVVSSFKAYSRQYDRVNLSIITYYEILSGLKHCDANKKLEVFLYFAEQNTVLSLTEEQKRTLIRITAFNLESRYTLTTNKKLGKNVP